MTIKHYTNIITILIVAILGNVGVADYLFTNGASDGLWRTDGNWNVAGAPGSGDHARISDSLTAVIDDETTAVCNYLVVGNSSSGAVSMSGGSLATSGEFWLSQAGDASFTMTNGTVNVLDPDGARIGCKPGYNALLQIEGGTFTTPKLYVPHPQASTTGTAKVNLFGGMLEVTRTDLTSLLIYGDYNGSIEMRGDGVLKWHGDRAAALNDLINNKELIYAGQTGATLEITEHFDTDGTTVLYNTVTVVPPENPEGDPDLNTDGAVENLDLRILAENWLQNTTVGDIIGEDSFVNYFDFSLLAGFWFDFDQTYFFPEDYGAVGDGVTDDTDAFYAASQAIEAANGGKLYLSPGKTYRVGRQYHVFGQYPYWQAARIIYFENVTGKITILGNGATLKANEGLKYGSYHPITGEPYIHEDPEGFRDPDYRTGAYKGMIDVLNCSDIEIRNINLDGNISSLELGGYWSDLYQCYAHGIHLIDVDNAAIYDVNSSYHGFDGLYVRHRYINENSDPTPVYIENSIFNYNGRQGFSWVGGIGLTAVNCKFNHTGKAPDGFYSPPAAGVDIEPLDTELCLDGNFVDCDFVDNRGCGFVANNPEGRNVKNVEFNNCLFWGTTNWSLWPFQKQLVFKDCRIYGTLVNVYFSESQPELSGKFLRCHFEDYTGYYEGQLYDSHRGNGGLLQFHGDNIIIEDSNIVANSLRAFYMAYDDQEIIRDCTVTHKYVYGGASQSTITGASIENTQFKEELPAGTNYFIDVNNVTVGPGVIVDGPQCKWQSTSGPTGTIPEGTY